MRWQTGEGEGRELNPRNTKTSGVMRAVAGGGEQWEMSKGGELFSDRAGHLGKADSCGMCVHLTVDGALAKGFCC